MKNKLKFIPFLLAVPLLFMANSPAPGPKTYQYSDFEITDLTFSEPDENGLYSYSATIENKGDSYISLYHCYIGSKSSSYYRFKDKYDSYRACVPPHSSATYYSRDLIDEKFTLEESEFWCEAYNSDGTAEYSKVEFVSKEEISDKEQTYYTFKIVDYKAPSKERYSPLITLSIKGEKMCYLAKFEGKNNQFTLDLSDSSLVAEDFAFESIDLTIYYTYGISLNGLLTIFGILSLISFGAICFGGIIFVSIFFSIRGVKKRKDDMPLPPPSLNG